MLHGEEGISPHTFNITELTKTDERVKKSVRAGLSAIWDKYVGSPRTFNIVLALFYMIMMSLKDLTYALYMTLIKMFLLLPPPKPWRGFI